MIRALLLGTTLLLASTPLTAAELRGRVVDGDTGEPLAAANVEVSGLDRGAATDSLGRFAIGGLQAGVRLVRATHVGYVAAAATVTLGPEVATVELALTPTVLSSQAVIVTGTRARERQTPVAFSNIDRTHIERTLTTADVPSMLNELPSVHTWSVAGNGVGYTYLSIRGFPQERIAVTLNGFPLNDPESHMVYWVNIPDLMESVEDIQVQRGVGTSPYGAAAIGGSVNLVTGTFGDERGVNVTGVTGSYGTRKLSVELNSGTVEDRYQLHGRFSRITSDGYRHQSWSDLYSYYLGAVRLGRQSTLRLNVFGGREQTHFAFYGATAEQLEADRRANPFSPYEQAKDDFSQPHYQLIHEWDVTPRLRVSNRLYTVRGDGFFNDQHYDAAFNPLPDIRRDVLDMEQYGWLPRVEWCHGAGSLTVGGELRTNQNRHWGEVLGAELVSTGDGAIRSQRLYDFDARKTTAGVYVHERYQPLPVVQLEGHLSIIGHRFDIGDDRVLEQPSVAVFDYVFVMPRAGANLNMSPRLNVYANYSLGRREPALTDLFDPPAFFGDPDRRQAFEHYDPEADVLSQPRLEAEKLHNYELGMGYALPRLYVKANLYIMDFADEIVATGQVLGTGTFDHANAARSTHRGIELSATARPVAGWTVAGNAAFSRNELERFEDAALEGNRVPNFPDRLANLRVSYQRGDLWTSLRLRHVGGYYFDLHNTPGYRVEPFTLTGLRLSYRLEHALGTQRLEPSLEIDNLLDVEYETWGGLYFGTPTWIAGAARNYAFTLKVML